MRTAPQPRAFRGEQSGAELYAALELTPAEQAETGQAGKRRGHVKLFSRHQPRHALPAEGAVTDEDAEAAADEFRGMKDIEAALENGGALQYYQPPARQTGPQPARATGPQPSFTPAAVRQTGPMGAARARHRGSEADRILSAAWQRASAVPQPPPPPGHPVTAAQASASLGRLRYPAPDVTDGYGGVPAYVAMMRVADVLTGTTSRYGYPAAWPLPVAPQARKRGLAIPVEAAPEPPAEDAEDES